MIRLGPAKLLIDGSLGARTAALYEPYEDDPTTKGLTMMSPEELNEKVKKIHEQGFQVAVHAIGDYGIDLVINAIEAIDNNGQLNIVIYPEKDEVVISFTNTGPSIPPEILPIIFEPFLSTKPEGSGLGLWVSHGFIQQHGGSLSVENLTDDQGVIFTIKLPVSSHYV